MSNLQFMRLEQGAILFFCLSDIHPQLIIKVKREKQLSVICCKFFFLITRGLTDIFLFRRFKKRKNEIKKTEQFDRTCAANICPQSWTEKQKQLYVFPD